MNAPEFSLKQLIRSIHQELLESETEREVGGLDPLFVVESLTVDLSFVVTKSGEGSGALNLKIVSAGGGVKYSKEEVQRITLQLKRYEPGEDQGGSAVGGTTLTREYPLTLPREGGSGAIKGRVAYQQERTAWYEEAPLAGCAAIIDPTATNPT